MSEHASWSGCFYFRIIQAALAAAGAPDNLVHVITGYVEFFILKVLYSSLLSVITGHDLGIVQRRSISMAGLEKLVKLLYLQLIKSFLLAHLAWEGWYVLFEHILNDIFLFVMFCNSSSIVKCNVFSEHPVNTKKTSLFHGFT